MASHGDDANPRLIAIRPFAKHPFTSQSLGTISLAHAGRRRHFSSSMTSFGDITPDCRDANILKYINLIGPERATFCRFHSLRVFGPPAV